MRKCIVLLTMAVVAPAQNAPIAGPQVTISAGVPLRVALEHRVAIKRVGDPIQGRMIEPVYIYDRMVIPAGTAVEGHIAEIGGVPAMRRIQATLSGNFTPRRDVRAQFDTLVFSDGSRIPLQTSLSRGTAHTKRVVTSSTKRNQRQTSGTAVEEPNRAAVLAYATPGRLSRLKSAAFAMFPYHKQAWTAGTLFHPVLQESLTGLPAVPVVPSPDTAVAPEPEAQEVEARLVTTITSATARKGAVVDAIVTRPVFSADRKLLLPEGSRLRGEVVEARRARLLHRNGKVLFAFHQVSLPAGSIQSIQGYLEGIEADSDAHIALDSEGAARTASPKARFIFPAIAALAAGLSFHQDFNSQGVPDQDIAGRAESGAVGLGMIGTVLAQASRTLASTIAITGASSSIYTNFLARGQDVVLPANTPLKVTLKPRDR